MTKTDGVLQINRPSGSYSSGFYDASVDPAGGSGTSVMYFSALLNIDSGLNGGARFGLDLNAPTLSGSGAGTRLSEIGFTENGNAAIWSNATTSTAATPNVTSTSTFNVGETHFLVGKIEDASNWSGSNDRVTLWVNPTGSTEASNTPSLTLEVGTLGLVPSDSQIGLFRFQAGTNDFPETAQLDELRIGTGFGDITVIPEPSTYAAIFGICALGLTLWRRRK